MNASRNVSRRTLLRTTGALALAGAFISSNSALTAPLASAAPGPGPVPAQVLD